MEQYAIVYFPNINTRKIESFRKKYDPNSDIIAPHITLVLPFSNIPIGEISKHIELVVKGIQPFQIHLQGLMKTDDDLLFLLVKEGKDKIIKIHNLLYSGILSSLEQKYAFNPHITIGEFEISDIQKAYAEAQKIDLNFKTIFNTITLIKGNGTSPAKTIKEFRL